MSLLPYYKKGKTAFLCIDLQGIFSQRIANFRNCVFVANRFARMHELLPQHTVYVATEQYSKRFGSTVPDIILPQGVSPIGKMSFTALTAEVKQQLGDAQHVVVFGIEAHVCVLQTVEDLLRENRHVYLPLDGVGSQKETDKNAAIELMRTWGPKCIVSTSESLLLQLIRSADDDKFKQTAAILKEQPPLPL